jgi:hypothetical protein
MAYKFQQGQAILSGAVDQEGSIDIKDDGSGEFELKHDGNTIINSSRAMGGLTAMSASTSVSGRDLVLDVGGKVGISTDTDLMTLTAGNVVIAGAHSASARIDAQGLRIDTGGVIGTAGDTDLLTLNNNSLVVAGAGTFSGGNIAASAGAVSGSTGLAGRGLTIDVGGAIGITTDTDLIALTANNVAVAGALSSSTNLSGRGLVIDSDGVIGTSTDADLMQLGDNKLKIVGDLSASADLEGANLVIGGYGTIGVHFDTDLMRLMNQAVHVSGALSASAAVQAKSLRLDTNGVIGTFGDADLLTLQNNKLFVNGHLSSSAELSAGGAVQLDGAINADMVASDSLYFMDSDGTMKRDLASDVRDLFFSAVSGDATIAAGGAATIQANAVEAGMLATNIIDQTTDIGANLAITDEFLVSDGGTLKKADLSRLALMMAGAGLVALNGQLVAESSEVRVIDDTADLDEGYNFYTGSANKSVNLPASPTVGDVVVIKAGDLGDGNALTVSRQGSHLIDGLTEVKLESDYAAASFVYLEADNWGIV